MFRVFVAAQLLCMAAAYPSFKDKIPNARSVPCWEGATNCVDFCDGVGHQSCSGGDARNEFGLAFKTAGFSWTTELCQADSDGDGFTNGQELGDPCCEWTAGGVAAAGDAVSHPGFTASLPLDGYTPPTCGGSGVGSSNPSHNSSGEGSGAYSGIAPTQGNLGGFNDWEEQKHVDFRIANYTLPPIETLYVSFRFNFDDELADVFHIVFGIALVELPVNLHHFVVYGCSEKADPREVGEAIYGRQTCEQSLGGFAGWAPGGVLWDVPKNTGIPIGRGVGIVGLEIQVHYTDAQLSSVPLVSTDGIRMFYTPSLRPNVAMSLQILGLGSHDDMEIPPHEERFFIQRTCTVIHWGDSECFDFHGDAINVGHALNRSVTGCGGLADLCHGPNEDIMAEVGELCPRTCGHCQGRDTGNSTGGVPDAGPIEGYRYAADGYCCSQDDKPSNYEEEPIATTFQGCVDFCDERSECAGFTYVTEERVCYWAKYWPESMNVVPMRTMGIYLKEGHPATANVHVNGEGGPCNEEAWPNTMEPGLEYINHPCGECRALLFTTSTWENCDEKCAAAGRRCVDAWEASEGCSEDAWRGTDCGGSSRDNLVCECSADIVDTTAAERVEVIWDMMGEGGNREPLGELNWTSSFYHAHLIGREMYQARVRDGVFRDLESQPRWDFNYQANFPVDDTTIKSGDVLHGMCVFNSKDRTRSTPIGLSTYDEMCFVMGQVVYPLNGQTRLPYTRQLSCTGGVIWTGSIEDGVDPLEDPARFMQSHPWYEGRQIYASSEEGEVDGEKTPGLCSKYFRTFRGTVCYGDGTWERNGCDAFFMEDRYWEQMSPRLASSCEEALNGYLMCMEEHSCTEVDQFHEEMQGTAIARRNMKLVQICGEDEDSCDCRVRKDSTYCSRECSGSGSTCECAPLCDRLERDPCEVDELSCQCYAKMDPSMCDCRWEEKGPGCSYCESFCADGGRGDGGCPMRVRIPRWMSLQYGAHTCDD